MPKTYWTKSVSWMWRSIPAPPIFSKCENQSPEPHVGLEMIRLKCAPRTSPYSPFSTVSFTNANSGKNRSTWATIRNLPVRSAASIIRSAFSSVRAIGFSTSTCLPASNACTATSGCIWVGRQMSIRSRPGSARMSETSVYFRTWDRSCTPPSSPKLPLMSRQSPWSFFGFRVQIAATVASSMFWMAL